MNSPLWDTWKKSFDVWEGNTAEYLEKVLRNPLILQPSGKLLGATMRAKATADRLAATWWGFVGLSTKRDQERELHKLNQLESKLLDLEEKIAEIEQLLQKNRQK
ncbi:MAG: hypothetical protein HUU55_02105 [Myxococcales bacterium]|nr:hypothetical protein [Myxococcales bacterium]